MNPSTIFRPLFFFTLLATMLLSAPFNELQAQKKAKPNKKGKKVMQMISNEELLDIMKAEDYDVEINSDGRFVWNIHGVKALMLIPEDKLSIQFYVGITGSTATIELVNQWNLEKKYSKSYIDGDGDPVIELDLDLDGGVTVNRIIDFIKTCDASLAHWIDDVIRQ